MLLAGMPAEVAQDSHKGGVMNEKWTAAEYNHFLKTGNKPRRNHEQEREVVEVKTGRMHRKMVKRPDVGVTFASLTEERRYDWLMAQPDTEHVDVHPIFTLPHGIRYHADFLVHLDLSYLGFTQLQMRAEDVKSKRSMTTAFKRLKAIFDDSHPWAPLWIVQWIDGRWVETR